MYGVHCHESGSIGEFHGGSRLSPPEFLEEFARWTIDQVPESGLRLRSMNTVLNRVFSEPTRISQARARDMPAPAATPLTAAMDGLSSPR